MYWSQRSMSGILPKLPSALIFETEFLIEPGAQRLMLVRGSVGMSLWDAPFPDPKGWGYACILLGLAFYSWY